MPDRPTVFIVDDDPAARDSIAALVKSKGLSVEPYASAEEFLSAYDVLRPGCLVTDVRMTGMNGLELQEVLRQNGICLPVIVITGFGEVPAAVRAMKAGAFTFLEKPCHDQDLWMSIRQALDLAERLDSRRARRDQVKHRLSQLTLEELMVMRALISGKQNKNIAAQFNIGLRTVELRRAKVLKKMQADSLAELVRLAVLAGEIPADPLEQLEQARAELPGGPEGDSAQI